MPRRYSSKELIRILQRDGWFEVRQCGSHKQFKHPRKPGTVTVPHPKSPLHPKTAASILAQAELREE
jgi:predicted RNA binding protein YcfA (HicA-like mRNA interferase family)